MNVRTEMVAIGEDTLEAVQHEGAVWVVLRRACEALGIDHDSQRTKLAAKPWATTALITVVDPAGRQRPVFALHAESMPLWLATLDRVRPELREKLRRFQLEARDVLARHFGGAPPAVVVPTGDPVEIALQAALEIRREQRALAARVEAVDDKATRALELADRASRAGVQARVSTDRRRAAVGHISRNVQRHCAAHGLDFATVFREGRSDIGLRPTREGGPPLGKADLRVDQILRLARFFAAQGVAGVSARAIEEILHGGGDDAALEVTA